MMRLLRLCGLFIGISLINSCSDTPKTYQIDISSQLDSISVDSSNSAFSSVLDHYSKAIPAPAEFTSFLFNSGLEFQKEILHKPSQQGNYITNFKKALNIGVYGADLCYLSLYKKNREMPPYFEAVRSLMVDLRVDRVVAFEKYAHFVENPNDSVLNLLSMDFERVNNFLLEGNQSNLSWLVAFGGWVESLYFSTHSVKSNSAYNETLNEKLAEQKLVFDDFLHMMEAYKNDDGFSELSIHMQDLKLIFDQVQVDYKTSEKTSTHEENGVLVVDDLSTSTFKMNEATYNALQSKLKNIRTFIIK